MSSSPLMGSPMTRQTQTPSQSLAMPYSTAWMWASLSAAVMSGAHTTSINSSSTLRQSGVEMVFCKQGSQYARPPVKSDVDFEDEGVPIHLAILG